MKHFKLSPQQVVVVNNSIELLAENGGYLTREDVFEKYSLYRRQDTAERLVETLDDFLSALGELRSQLNDLRNISELDQTKKNAVLLETQLDSIISAATILHRRHRTAYFVAKGLNKLFG